MEHSLSQKSIRGMSSLSPQHMCDMNASLQDYLPQTTNTQFSSRPRSLCEEFHTLSTHLPSIYLLSFPLHVFQFWSFPNICLFISWVLQINPVTFSHLHYLCLVLKKSPCSQEWNIIQAGLIKKRSWAERRWLGHCISLQCSWEGVILGC